MSSGRSSTRGHLSSELWCFFVWLCMCFCLYITGFVLQNILMSMVTNNVFYSLVDHCIKILIGYGSVFVVPVVTMRRRRWCVRRARWPKRCWRSSWSAWSPGSCWIFSVSSVSVPCLYFHTSVANDFSQVDMNSNFFDTWCKISSVQGLHSYQKPGKDL